MRLVKPFENVTFLRIVAHLRCYFGLLGERYETRCERASAVRGATLEVGVEELRAVIGVDPLEPEGERLPHRVLASAQDRPGLHSGRTVPAAEANTPGFHESADGARPLEDQIDMGISMWFHGVKR